MSNQIEKLKINDLAISGSYIVPIYQRNYAWGDTEINLLLDDILDAFKKNKANKKNKAKYYIGSLVVFKRDNNFEVIDGQQRLTTLSILLSSLENKININLSFQHREASNNSLKKIEDVIQSPRIEEGFEIIGRKLAGIKKILGINYSEFEDFILENVIILRTEVPEHTDLNHYFEIMNSRGEQLEKHEVVKARLMDLLEKSDSNEQKAFSMIWNACSNMDFYALKGFPYSSKKEESLRTKLFGDDCNGTLFSMKFDDLKSHFESSTGSKNIASLKDILAGNNQSENLYNDENFSKEEKTDAKFNSIIDFPNFLMHVLRIYLKGKEIPLNDKELITEFKKITIQEQAKEKAKEKAKEFIMILLRTRLLFDRYIIKSKPDIEDGWSLKGLKKYSTYFKEVNTFGKAWEDLSSSEEQDNQVDANEQDKRTDQEKIIKLLSMFHVSFRQRIYKEWLYDVLEWLYAKNEDKYSINASSYISFLEKLANKYYCDGRGDENPLLDDDFPLSKESKLNQGTRVNNYVFNYLDYLIWRDGNLCDKASKFLPLDKFKFSMSRNSIEHYFSQNRVSELKNDSLLENFGNLCLISNYQNSSLSDENCKIKKDFYIHGKWQCTSPKQAIMLSYEEWNDKSIDEHNKAMRSILNNEINEIQRCNSTS